MDWVGEVHSNCRQMKLFTESRKARLRSSATWTWRHQNSLAGLSLPLLLCYLPPNSALCQVHFARYPRWAKRSKTPRPRLAAYQMLPLPPLPRSRTVHSSKLGAQCQWTGLMHCRRKYAKMRIKFALGMKESENLIREDLRIEDISKRIQEQNECVLHFIPVDYV